MSYPFSTAGYPYGQSQPGLDLDFIETLGPLSTSSQFTIDAGVYLTRFLVPAPVTFNTISCYIGNTSSGNVDAGVYEKTTGGFSLMGSSGSTPSGATSAVQNLTLDPAVSLTPGTVYYLALAKDAGDVAALVNGDGVSAVMAFFDRFLFKADVFPLPDTLASADAASTVPWLLMRNV